MNEKKYKKIPKLTQQDFLERAKKVHGDKYTYEKSIYINNKKNIIITCKLHGDFIIRGDNFLNGQGCVKCSKKIPKLTQQDFLERAKKVHGDKYTYEKSIYTINRNKIIITCKLHGDFIIKANSFLNGQGCNVCHLKKLTFNIFLERAKKVHGDEYTYIEPKKISSFEKIKIICKEHGIFEQMAYAHLQGQGCPKCKRSNGEKNIANFLLENKINFVEQKTFKDCFNLRKLKFDFFIPEKNIVIEYNGKQHYQPIKYFGGEESFNKIKKTDGIKKEYCKKNKILLIDIKYDDSIKEKLNEILYLLN